MCAFKILDCYVRNLRIGSSNVLIVPKRRKMNNSEILNYKFQLYLQFINMPLITTHKIYDTNGTHWWNKWDTIDVIPQWHSSLEYNKWNKWP